MNEVGKKMRRQEWSPDDRLKPVTARAGGWLPPAQQLGGIAGEAEASPRLSHRGPRSPGGEAEAPPGPRAWRSPGAQPG